MVMRGLLCLVTLAGTFELPVPRPSLVGVPDLSKHDGWTSFIKERTPAGKAIACLPFAPGTSASDFDGTVRWMYYGTLHGVPLVNGYSGFFPDAYMKLRAKLSQEGLTQQNLATLADMRTHFIVTRETLAPSEGRFQLRLVFQDPTGITVHGLVDTEVTEAD